MPKAFRVMHYRKNSSERGMAMLEYALGAAGVVVLSYAAFATLSNSYNGLNNAVAGWVGKRAAEVQKAN